MMLSWTKEEWRVGPSALFQVLSPVDAYQLVLALPAGCRVLGTARGGESLWVETLRIEVELPDGTEQVFFKKGASGPVGLNMMKGAFESEKALYSFIPEYVPVRLVPVAAGHALLHRRVCRDGRCTSESQGVGRSLLDAPQEERGEVSGGQVWLPHRHTSRQHPTRQQVELIVGEVLGPDIPLPVRERRGSMRA